MAKYRKKPVVIEATQWWAHGDHNKVRRLTEDLHLYSILTANPEFKPPVSGYGWIETLEGPMVVSPGDWIIEGVEGEFYPVKAHIFEKTYFKDDGDYVEGFVIGEGI